jgi:hypothetical protein
LTHFNDLFAIALETEYNIAMITNRDRNKNWQKAPLALLLLLLLAACNLPSQPVATPTPDAVATQVSQLLTEMPTPTVPLPPADTPTPAPTDTPAVPTDTPVANTATPTLAADSPGASLGNPSWYNNLESGRAFYLFENENTLVTHADGSLVLTGLTANGWHGWSLTFTQQPVNFYLEAVFNPQDCSGADIYGLVFRAESVSSGYFFGVTCDGRYNLSARNFEDGSNTPLINLTSSQAIQTGGNVTNRLGVRAEGERIALYANGVLLQEVTDATFDDGYIGAFVAANATPGFTVRMDEISLWNLP